MFDLYYGLTEMIAAHTLQFQMHTEKRLNVESPLIQGKFKKLLLTSGILINL